jgi:predicted nucleic acid-binding protein
MTVAGPILLDTNGVANRLGELAREFVVVDINDATVLRAYATIHAHLVARGHPVGDNDVWIASCAVAASATLITTDKDFDVLNGSHVTRLYFEPNLQAPS